MCAARDHLAAALADRYRIERELGQGGMATVYLAEDLKHDRKVALKVLKPELAAVLGAERFVVEIKTTAALQHPHILPLFDSGRAVVPPLRDAERGTGGEAFFYYVMPYIQGETLRNKLDREKQLGIDEAVKITTEVADALDYAHRHGVIHRDIKPENILLHDGRPMVADFGIALAVSAAAGGRMTETGLSLGTPHYMSPEQAAAEKDITAKSDVYSLASVLYEMLSGQPPHLGGSAQQIIMKIIAEPVPAVTSLRKSVPPNVAAALMKALEKLPADRFGSAKAFAEALNDPHFTTGAGEDTGDLAVASVRAFGGWVRSPWSWGMIAVAAGAVAAGIVIARSATPGSAPLFIPRTFEAQSISNARFMPDGQAIVFSGMPAVGSVSHLFVTRPDHPDPVPVGPDSVHLLSVSRTGRLAVVTHARYLYFRLFEGTLATMSLGGEAPHDLTTGVREADWAPDDTSLAVIRDTSATDMLEFPVGTILVRSNGYLSDPRVSPSGDAVAYVDHPTKGDDRGAAVIVDRAGHELARSPGFWGVEGIAWRPSGKGILYSAPPLASSNAYAVRALDRSGRDRFVLSGPGNLTIQDISPTGRALLTEDERPVMVMGRGPDATADVRIGVRDYSSLPALSGDGRHVAFSDAGALGGATYTALVRKTDGSPPVKLGDGSVVAITANGGLVLAFVPTTPPKIMLYPTGTGVAMRVDSGRFRTLSLVGAAIRTAGPDTTVFFCGARPQSPERCYIDSLPRGALTAVTPAGTGPAWLSPDGTRVLATTGNGLAIYPVGGGQPRPAIGFKPSDRVVRWSPDGRTIWVQADRLAVLSTRIEQVDPETGARSLLVRIAPRDLTNVRSIDFFTLADNPHIYAYAEALYQSQLYTVDGVR